MKYTKEQRLEIGKKIYEGKLTLATAAVDYDINLYTARDYFRMYKASANQPEPRQGSKAIKTAKSAKIAKSAKADRETDADVMGTATLTSIPAGETRPSRRGASLYKQMTKAELAEELMRIKDEVNYVLQLAKQG